MFPGFLFTRHQDFWRIHSPLPGFKILGYFNALAVLCSTAEAKMGLLIQPQWTVWLQGVWWRLWGAQHCAPHRDAHIYQDKTDRCLFYSNIWSHPDYIYFLILTQGHVLLVLEREEGRRRERGVYERETSISCLLYASWPGTEPATSFVLWPGIKPVNFWCVGQCSN